MRITLGLVTQLTCEFQGKLVTILYQFSFRGQIPLPAGSFLAALIPTDPEGR
jgi:hypothetical protein